MIKKLLILFAIFLLCLGFASGEKVAFAIIESATPGILGAILGGLIAGISIIFSVLLTVSSSSDTTIKLGNFNVFLLNLKNDIIVLLLCLVASLILPYLRVTGIPLLSYPTHALMPSRDVIYTATELAVIVVSVTIIIEVFNVMFSLFGYFTTLRDNEE